MADSPRDTYADTSRSGEGQQQKTDVGWLIDMSIHDPFDISDDTEPNGKQ